MFCQVSSDFWFLHGFQSFYRFCYNRIRWDITFQSITSMSIHDWIDILIPYQTNVSTRCNNQSTRNKSSREKKIFGPERRLHFLTRFFYTSFRLMKNFGDEINFAEKTEWCPNSNRVWEKLRFRIDSRKKLDGWDAGGVRLLSPFRQRFAVEAASRR